MRRGTKIGWILVAVSVVLSVWVIASQSSHANQTIDGAFIVSDDGTQLIEYTGPGGNVTIPDGVATIDAGVFANNTSITSVTIPASVTSLGSGVFQGCSSMQSISLSSSLGSIPDNTFRECTSLSSVSIPGSVGSIGSSAFYGCASLSGITIPASVSNLALDAFRQCGNLSSISVASGSSYYASSDGCLYNSSMTRLLMVPEGKTSVSMPAGATTIASGAMQDCGGLTSITLPNNLKTIEAGALSGSSISSITIPASVTTIGSQSGWTPATIYGVADSAAETYAKDNSVPFIVLGSSEGETNTDEGQDDNQETSEGTSGETNKKKTSKSSKTNNENAAPATESTEQGQEGNGSGNVAAATAAGGNGTHTLDQTPTTADGIDPRYFLCFAVFAGGVGVILYSRFNKMKYVSNNKNR